MKLPKKWPEMVVKQPFIILFRFQTVYNIKMTLKEIPKKFTKKFGNKVINRQYFCRKTGLTFASIHID